MTLLLASVTGTGEAAVVLAHGADIIDLKDAPNGALGALAPDVVRATVAAIQGRRPVSAVAGDLPMDPDVIVAAVETMARTEVEYVKVGLFPGPGTTGLRAGAGVRWRAPPRSLASCLRIAGLTLLS